MPWSIWLGLGGVVLAAGAWGVASAVVPNLTDPNQTLNRVARKVAAGPSSVDEARSRKQELDNEVKAFISKNLKLTTPELVHKLQTTLGSDAFETHGFDLPRGLKVVEIDTILQASEYLIMSTASGAKVLSLPGIEVFDAAQVVKDQTGASLVIIGHSAGQGAHHPEIKVYALLPDDIRDETANAVPPLIGDGAATFAPNRKDIIADFSLYSIAVAEHIFKPWPSTAGRAEEETVRENLVWRDGKYTLNRSLGKGALSAQYAVASCLQKPALVSEYESYLASKATRFINNLDGKIDSPNFGLCKVSIREKRRSAPTIGRLLLGKNGNNFLIELQQGGRSADARVIASNISKADDKTVALGLQQNPQIAAGIKSPDGGMDPALNPHEAQIIEKKPEPADKSTESAERTSKTNTSTTIEDKIIATDKTDQKSAEADKGKQSDSDEGKTDKSKKHDKSSTETSTTAAAVDNGKNSSNTNPNAPLKNATIVETSPGKGAVPNPLVAGTKTTKKPAPITIQTAPNTEAKPLAMVPPGTTKPPSQPEKPDEQTKSSKSKKSDKANSKGAGKSDTSKSDAGKSDATTSTESDTTKSDKSKSKRDKSRTDKSKSETTEASKPSKSDESTSSAGQTAHIAIKSGTVRVRTGPGAEYREIGFVTKESQFAILGEKKGWYKVRANGQVGYVLASLVSAPGGPSNIKIENDVTDQSYKGSRSSRRHGRDRSGHSRHDSSGFSGFPTSTGSTSSKAPKKSDEPPPFVP